MKRKKGNIAFGFAIGSIIVVPIFAFIFDASLNWVYFMIGSAIFMLGVGLIIEEIRKLKN